jgi:hypothetical protein
VTGDLLPLLVALPLLGAGTSLMLARHRVGQRSIGVLVLAGQLGLSIAVLTGVFDGSTVTARLELETDGESVGL